MRSGLRRARTSSGRRRPWEFDDRSDCLGTHSDTGALLGLERGDSRVRALLRMAGTHELAIAVPAGVVARAWRGGRRQARVARLLSDPGVSAPPLDELTARAVGLLCGRTGHSDVVDVQVALHARQHSHRVVTSDPDDLHAIDPELTLIVV